MAHIEHFKKSDVKRLANEYDRDDKYMTSQDVSRIDLGRIEQDYVLSQNEFAPRRSMDEYRRSARPLSSKIESRLSDSDLTVSSRKDLNVMSCWIVTVPDELKGNKEQEDKFLRIAYDFTCERYGRNNVMDGFVHKDETSPHIHIPVIPVKDDRVSSKALFTRTELSQYHKELDKRMEIEFGMPGLILNGRTKGNYTVSELKERTKHEKAILRREKEVEDIEVLQRKINALEDRVERLEDYARQFDKPKFSKAVNDTKNHVHEVMSEARKIKERETAQSTKEFE